MSKPHEEGRVYAIDDGQGCVKLGWTKDPVRRLREMNVSDAGRLTLIGSASGTRTHEAKLHALLKPWRERGEWFRKEGAVLAFLEMLPKYDPPGEREYLAASDFGLDEVARSSIDDLFAMLGGPAEVGRMLNVSTEHASTMKRRGSIPVRYWPRLIDETAKRGHAVVYGTLVAIHAGRHAENSSKARTRSRLSPHNSNPSAA